MRPTKVSKVATTGWRGVLLVVVIATVDTAAQAWAQHLITLLDVSSQD